MTLSRKTLLIISQVYVPDPTSVGQHMHDAAAELVRRGYRVVVYASARGYDPGRKYPSRESRDGVDIRRLPLSSFGKRSIKIRLLAQMLFLIQVMARAIWLRRLDRILVSTSPPMASIAALFIRLFRRAPLVFWAMDINPDQLIAMKQTSPTSFSARMFNGLNRCLLKQTRAVIALDRFMGDRLERKVALGDRLAIIPPWPHESHLAPIAHDDNPFRREHGLSDKFVVMYSGNISPAHPITTILEAAKRLQDDPQLVFLFIGGGNGKKQIDAFIDREKVSNVRTLPYQPLEMIKYSLSAADVHLVAMGNEMVGIVHPCKVYGAMAVGRPILFLGPRLSHIGEILDTHEIGWQVDQGDVASAVQRMGQIRQATSDQLKHMGEQAQQAIHKQFGMQLLCKRFCDAVES